MSNNQNLLYTIFPILEVGNLQLIPIESDGKNGFYYRSNKYSEYIFETQVSIESFFSIGSESKIVPIKCWKNIFSFPNSINGEFIKKEIGNKSFMEIYYNEIIPLELIEVFRYSQNIFYKSKKYFHFIIESIKETIPNLHNPNLHNINNNIPVKCWNIDFNFRSHKNNNYSSNSLKKNETIEKYIPNIVNSNVNVNYKYLEQIDGIKNNLDKLYDSFRTLFNIYIETINIRIYEIESINNNKKKIS